MFVQNLFILVGNDDIHKSLNVFKSWSDRTTDYGTTALEGLNGENDVITFPRLFLIKLFSHLQVKA